MSVGMGKVGTPHERRRQIDGQSQTSAYEVDPREFREINSSALGTVYKSIKAQYFKEAHEHPGVRLVAHTVS